MSLPTIKIFPGASLPSQPWWPALHASVNASFTRKSPQAIPESWTRLDPDPVMGARGLVEELGPQGEIAVAFDAQGNPIGCCGFLPFRGPNWINDVKGTFLGAATSRTDADAGIPGVPKENMIVPDWELCCVCVNPLHQRKGINMALVETVANYVRDRLGGQRLIASYWIEETGDYWPRRGFVPIPGANGVLKKGFTLRPELEGLRQELHSCKGARVL